MREKNINWLPLSCTATGAGAETWACAQARSQTNDPLFFRTIPNELSHTELKIYFKTLFVVVKYT